MADRGFTIKKLLQAIGVDLNIPPFMEGGHNSPEEMQQGQTHLVEFMLKEQLAGLKHSTS